MKKYFVAVLFFLAALTATGQEVSIRIVTFNKELPAEPNRWGTFAFNAIAKGPGQQGGQNQCKLVVQVKQAGQVICGNSPPNAPLTNGFSTRIITTKDLVAALGSCVLEPGQYSLSLQFYDAAGNSISAELNREFSVVEKKEPIGKGKVPTIPEPILAGISCQEKIIKRFIKLYGEIYNLTTMEGVVSTGPDAAHFAYQRFFASGYWGNIELHGDCDRGSLWIGFPQRHFDTSTKESVEFTKWFEYNYSLSGSAYDLSFFPTPGMGSPPYPGLTYTGEEGRKDIRPKNDGAWANFIDYDPVAVICDGFESLPGSMDVGTCIPHYSHILVPSGPKIWEIHKNFQTPSGFSTVQKLLEDAKPPACVDLPGKKEVEEILYYTCPPELRVIGWIAGKDLCKTISKKFTDITMRKCPELKKRNATGWQTVTLRGFVDKAEDPENDLAMDHIAHCYSGGSIPNGPVYPPAAYPPSPFNDWDLKITPDADLRYLGSDAKPDIVGVEIEKWLLPYKYQPQQGDYLQSMGRWVIDCGHPQGDDLNDGFYTEIHPPELLVSSNQVGEGAITEARVIVNGSWVGNDLKFLVWPLPRPEARSILKDAIVIERQDLCKMEIKPVPADNPNHLECTIRNTGIAQPSIAQRGFILYNCLRGFQAVIQAWWETPPVILTKKEFTHLPELDTEDPSRFLGVIPDNGRSGRSGYLKMETAMLDSVIANNFPFRLSGRLDGQGLSAADCFVFYKEESDPAGGWQMVQPGPDGKFSIPALFGKNYSLLPASVKYSFPNGVARVMVDNQYAAGDPNNPEINFHAARNPNFDELKDAGNLPPVTKSFDYQKTPGLLQLLAGKLQDQNRLISFEQEFKKSFISVFQPPGQGNEKSIYVHVASLVDTSNYPVSDLGRCLEFFPSSPGITEQLIEKAKQHNPFLVFAIDGVREKENAQQSGYVVLDALKGRGAKGVVLKAKLLIGSEASGYKLLEEEDGNTDVEGNVKFKFSSGLDFGMGKLVLEVTDNPDNPWFLPVIESEPFVFLPSEKEIGQGQGLINFNDFSIRSASILYGNGKRAANQGMNRNLTANEKSDRDFLAFMEEIYESDLWDNLASLLLLYRDRISMGEAVIVEQ